VSHRMILRAILVASAAAAASSVWAQNGAPVPPPASTGVAAIVNEFVISNYDLDQRTALFAATSGIGITKENQAQIRAQILRSLQDEVIELQEANKRKVSASRAEVERAVQSIAEDNKFTVEQLLGRLAQAGVTAATFRQQVKSADAVLFVTPEYNRSVPGVLKNALDVGSRPYGSSVWSGKPGAVVSVSPGAIGGFGANHHLRQSLVFLDVPTLQQPEAYIGGAAKLFDDEGRLINEGTQGFITKFMQAYAAWVEKHAS